MKDYSNFTMANSRGRCEMCEKVAICSDIPSKFLEKTDEAKARDLKEKQKDMKRIYERMYDGKPEGFSSATLPNKFLGTFEVKQQLHEDAWEEQFIGIKQEDGKYYFVEGEEVSGRFTPEKGGMVYSIKEITAYE